MKKIVIKQNDKYSCAVACVLSIIKYYGGYISYEELACIINTTKFGTNALDIINGIKNIGLEGRGIKCSFEELKEFPLNNPLIAHVKNNDMYHFVVIYEINNKKERIKVMDPGKGLIWIKYKEFEKNYLNTVIEIILVNELPTISDKVNYFKYLKGIINQNKKTLIIILFLSLLVIVFSILHSYILNYILELEKHFIILFVITILFKNIFNYIKDIFIVDFENKIGIHIINYTISHILNVPSKYIKSKTTGDILERIREIEEFKSKIIEISLNLFVNILVILATLILLALVNIKMFEISIAFIIFFIIVSFIYSNIIKRNIENTKEYLGMYESFLNETITNYKSIKNVKVETKIKYKVMSKYYKFITSFKTFARKVLNMNLIKNVYCDSFVIISLIFICQMIKVGEIKIINLLYIYSLVSFIIEPLKEMTNYFVGIKDLKISFKRIKDLLLIREEDNYSDEILDGNIQIKNLKTRIFSNINFDIKKGQVFLLYGKSGVGKSTLLKILVKELEKYEGNIYINNMNLKDIDKDVINNSFTYVTQEEHLFSDTLENNIKFFRDINSQEYEEVLKVTKVDLIRDKKGFRNDFLIYEDGVNLSGGERQKIVLARALLKKSSYLILDEALSEVGFNEEIEIINNIKQSFKDLTIIYVSHKKEVIENFKNSYELKGGDGY